MEQSDQRSEGSLFTIEKTCEKLQVSRSTVNRLIQTRELPSVKIRRRRLIPERAIIEFIEQREKEEGMAGYGR